MLWIVAGLFATVYCVARAVRDLRQKEYAWAALGLASAVILVSIPVQTHAVKVTLPELQAQR